MKLNSLFLSAYKNRFVKSRGSLIIIKQKTMFHHAKMMASKKKFLKKFKIKTENQGDKFVITLAGKPEDVNKLEEKLKAIKTLCNDCCCDC